MNIDESVRLLLNSKDNVVERFYEHFLTQFPELKRHFDTRDMRVQASMLTIGLMSVEAYYTCRFPAVGHYFRVLGHRHYHNGIRKQDYPKFRVSLLAVLAQFHGDEWSDELHNQWGDAVDLAIDLMLEGYSQTFTF